MMRGAAFISTTGSGLARASMAASGLFEVETLLMSTVVRCLAADPLDRERVYAGTQRSGVLRSDDRGRTWRPAGLDGQTVNAVAASHVRPGVVYAGTKPAGLFVSRDGGDSWRELDALGDP